MKIDRYMVNLFFEIRRNLPLALQDGMTISNPNVGDQMVKLYRTTKDDNIKLLITVFLKRAGEEWHSKIAQKKRLYRGAEVLEAPRPEKTTKRTTKEIASAEAKKSKPKRIYRGQVIE